MTQNFVKVSQEHKHIIVKNAGGLRGVPGPQGPSGEPGQNGADGTPATVAVGTTSTLPAGSSATVTNTGTTSDAVLNFGIPKGEKGDKGDKGDAGAGLVITGSVNTYADLPSTLGPSDAGKAYFVQADGKLYVWTGTQFPPNGEGTQFVGPQGPAGADGQDGAPGPANTLSIGTVTGGATADATITGTSPNQTLNLTLPKGADGTDGTDGYSPIATVTKSGDTATITITDKNGTTTATVSDGAAGTTDYNDLTNRYYTDKTLQATWDSVNGYYVITTTSPIRTTAPAVGDKIRIQFSAAHTGSAVQIKVNSDSVLGCVINTVSSTNADTPTVMTECSINRVYEFVKTQETGQSAVWACLDAYDKITSSQIATAGVTSNNIDWTTIKYSDSVEQPVGIDAKGDTVYRRLIDFGALPNNTIKLVASGIVGLKSVVSLTAIATISGGGTYLSLPYCHPSIASYNINIAYTSNSIQIMTGADRSNYTAVAVLEYTKS